MIESLTPEQTATFPFYVEKWRAIGLSTDPVSVKDVKPYILRAYDKAGLERPKYFFKFSSPLASAHAVNMVMVLEGYNDSIKSVGPAKSFTDPFLDSVFESLYEQYSNQYDEIEWNDDVKNKMRTMIVDHYNSGDTTYLQNAFDQFLYGSQEAPWLSFYDFFLNECDLKFIEDLRPHFEIAKRCGWWSAYTTAVFVQDRPSEIHFNDQNLLHNEFGPAVVYPDGYKVYALEGYWLEEKIVMDPNLITVEDIESESNAEKRRIMLSRYGYENYFNNSECEILDQDTVQVAVNDDREMPRMLLKTKNGDVFLVGTDGSTNRVYVMPVLNRDGRQLKAPTTCREAHELISGLSEDKCIAQS